MYQCEERKRITDLVGRGRFFEFPENASICLFPPYVSLILYVSTRPYKRCKCCCALPHSTYIIGKGVSVSHSSATYACICLACFIVSLGGNLLLFFSTGRDYVVLYFYQLSAFEWVEGASDVPLLSTICIAAFTSLLVRDSYFRLRGINSSFFSSQSTVSEESVWA